MSIEHRMSRNKHGERVLTVTLVGDYAIARFATHLLRSGCDFADVGRRVLRSQKRGTSDA